MRLALDRCGRRADVALDVCVIDRLSTGAALLDAGDEFCECLQRCNELLVLVRYFDHDASHGASPVESPREALDGTALPQLSSRALAYAAFRISSPLLRMRSTPLRYTLHHFAAGQSRDGSGGVIRSELQFQYNGPIGDCSSWNPL